MTLELPVKLNKDLDFAAGLHFPQYFNACPGLEILVLPASFGVWELGTSLRSLVLRICLWKRRVTKSDYEIGGNIRVGKVGAALSRTRTVDCRTLVMTNVSTTSMQVISRVKMTEGISSA